MKIIIMALTLTDLQSDSADNKLMIFFLFFLLFPKETSCMKCQILFSRKNKKKYFKLSSAEIFTQHAKCYFWVKEMCTGFVENREQFIQIFCCLQCNSFFFLYFFSPSQKFFVVLFHQSFSRLSSYFSLLKNVCLFLTLTTPFPENRLWHFMQTVPLGDGLHNMSKFYF